MRLVIAQRHARAATGAQAARRALWRAIDDADVVIHAGDWNDVPLLDEVEARASRLVAVYGNNDGPALRRRLPEVAREVLGGVRFAVVHETGGRDGRESRMAAQYPDTDVLVFGHSHIPWDTTHHDGLAPSQPGLADGPSASAGRDLPHGDRLDGRLSDVVLRRADDGAAVA